MGDKGAPGEEWRPPRAALWSSMVDAAQEYLQRATSDPPQRHRHNIPTDKIKIRNDSGGNRVRGEVLELTGTVLDVINFEHPQDIWIVGDTPTADRNVKPFAVLRYSVKSGKITDAQVSGVCIAKVNVGDIRHTHARSVSGSHILESGHGGPAELLYVPDTGEQECVVLLGPVPNVGYFGYIHTGYVEEQDPAVRLELPRPMTNVELLNAEPSGLYEVKLNLVGRWWLFACASIKSDGHEEPQTLAIANYRSDLATWQVSYQAFRAANLDTYLEQSVENVAVAGVVRILAIGDPVRVQGDLATPGTYYDLTFSGHYLGP